MFVWQNPTEAQRKEHEKYEFELHDVYAVDVLISTGKYRYLPTYKLTTQIILAYSVADLIKGKTTVFQTRTR